MGVHQHDIAVFGQKGLGAVKAAPVRLNNRERDVPFAMQRQQRLC